MSEFGLQALPDAATVAEMFPTGGTPAALDDPRAGSSARPRSTSCATTRVWTPALRQAQGPALRARGPALPLPSRATRTPRRQRCRSGSKRAGCDSETLSWRAELGEVVVTAEAPRASSPTPTPCSPSHREAPRSSVVNFDVAAVSPSGSSASRGHGVSWAVIDRGGRPKAAYEMLRRAYQPILIAACFPWRRYAAGDLFRAEVWLVNDGRHGEAVCAEALLDDTVVWTVTDIALPPASVSQIGELSVRLEHAPQAMVLALRCGEMISASNRYDLAVHLPAVGRRQCPGDPHVGERLLEWIDILLALRYSLP